MRSKQMQQLGLATTTIAVVAFAFLACGKKSSSTSNDAQQPATDAPDDTETEQTLTLSGVVKLSASITDDAVLTADQAIAGAKVFVRGFTDTTATTDASGAFTLKLTLPEGASLHAAHDFDVILWHTTAPESGTPVKYGVQQSIQAEPNVPKDLGTVSLAHTRQVRLSVVDAGTETTLADCSVDFPGYEKKIEPAYDATLERYVADYIPAATYKLDVDCPGYVKKSGHEITVQAATSAGSSDASIPTITMQSL